LGPASVPVLKREEAAISTESECDTQGKDSTQAWAVAPHAADHRTPHPNSSDETVFWIITSEQ